MPTDDREQQFERALARHLRGASPGAACPDPEILAAYHERTLSLEEMARWKEHISGCAHCQETLALVEQTANIPMAEWENVTVPVTTEELPAPQALRSVAASVRLDAAAPTSAAAAPASIESAAVRKRWRWIVPVGALAASAIVWVGYQEIGRQRASQSNSLEIAQNRAPAQPPASENYKTDKMAREEAPASPQPERTRSIPQSSTALLSPPAVPPAAHLAPKGDLTPPAEPNEKDLQKKSFDRPMAMKSVPAPAPPVSRDLDANARQTAAVADAGKAVSGVPAPSTLQAEAKKEAPGAVTESVEMQAPSPTPVPAMESHSNELRSKARSSFAIPAEARGDRRFIIAPGEKHAWRVGFAGTIERSTDGGKTWRPQASGVTAELTSGSAVSDKVCWIVGRAGTLLLTTDGGKHWKQLSSPIAGDLGGIRAADEAHATLWDASNRQTYETKDGGATWTQVAGK